MRPIFRSLATLSLVFALCAARPALALDSGDIVVASIKGEVHIAIRGADTKLRAGAVLELPATVRTGRDGAIELRQGATSISVGPETVLEFPALASPGGSIDRIVQPRGTSFYNVGKRGGRKLRIETPFLVGVVKGTQFSVVAQDHGTTISLFEGLLEVRSADDSDVVELHAGEIATRDRAATDISVLKMESGVTPPAPKPTGQKPAAPAPGTPRPGGDVGVDPRFVRHDDNKPVTSLTDSNPARVELNTSIEAPVINGGGVGVEVAVETPAGSVVPSVDAVIDTPVVTEGVNVDLGGAAVVDTTDTAVEVGVGTGVTEVDLGLDVDNSGPGNSEDSSGPGSGGNGSDNSGPSNSEDAAVAVDAGATVSPDTGVSVDVGVGVGNTQVDLGVDLGLVTDVDLGLEEDDSDNSGPGSGNSGSGNSGSGSGSDSSGSGSDNSGPGNVVDNVADLLEGLTGRSGRK